MRNLEKLTEADIQWIIDILCDKIEKAEEVEYQGSLKKNERQVKNAQAFIKRIEEILQKLS